MDDIDRINELERKLQEAEEKLKRYSEAEWDLQEAGKVQRGILPENPPYLEGYDISAIMQPAKGVGGDFYDYIPILSGRGKLGIIIGDVSGKGMPAALYMTLTHGMIHAGLSFASKFTTEKFLLWLNLQLMDISRDSTFVTMIYGVLDTTEHKFSYARAGHTKPYVFDKDGNTIYSGRDSGSGQALGVVPVPQLDSDAVSLPEKGLLILYSDGIGDETDRKDKMFSMERLERLVSKYRNLPSIDICGNVMDELEKYRKGTPQFDDCTLMVIKREK